MADQRQIGSSGSASDQLAGVDVATFGWAEQAAVVRAEQKDELYSRELFVSVTAALEATVGAGFINRHRPSLESACNLIYLLLTTTSGTPTLGEEYVDIRQVSHDAEVPSEIGRRTSLVTWQVIIPYLAKLLQSRILRRASSSFATGHAGDASRGHILGANAEGHRAGSNRDSGGEDRSGVILKQLGDAIPVFQAMAAVAVKFHLAWFYHRGGFSSLAHRLSGTRQLSLNSKRVGEDQELGEHC